MIEESAAACIEIEPKDEDSGPKDLAADSSSKIEPKPNTNKKEWTKPKPAPLEETESKSATTGL